MLRIPATVEPALTGTTLLRANAIQDTQDICAKLRLTNVNRILANMVDTVKTVLTGTFVVASQGRPVPIVKSTSMNAIVILAEMGQNASTELTNTRVSVSQDTRAYFVKPISMNVPRTHAPMVEFVLIRSMDSSVNALGAISTLDV